MGEFVQNLFRRELHKRSQGRIARQITLAALAIIVVIGTWRLNVWMVDQISTESREIWAYVIPFALGALGLWIAFRAVNYPTFAGFLISVEAEMNKVSWPSRSELIKASIVVIVVMFLLATILFAYDIFWKTLLQWLGILGSRGDG